MRYPFDVSNNKIGPMNDSPDLRSYLRFPACKEVLKNLADSNRISWNLTIILPSIQIAIRLMSFFYSTYSSLCNVLSLIDEI